MTFLRWPTRAIQGSVAKHVKAGLTTLGWFDATKTFAETLPITWVDDHSAEQVVAGGGPEKQNTVGISIGDVPDFVVQEIGAGLQSMSLPIFFDVYGENRSIALSLADDICGILQGELWAPSRFIGVYDFSVTDPELLTDRTIEARLVEARWPAAVEGQEWRHNWRIVAFTGQLWWTGSGNE